MTIYKLVGYDPETEFVAVEHEIPAAFVELAKTVAGILARPEIIGDYPLSREQATKISTLIGAPEGARRYDWFLEPYAQAARAPQTLAARTKM